MAAGSSELSSECFREAVYELQSAFEVQGAANTALEEQNRELKRKYDEVKEQYVMLSRRMDALERRPDGEAAQPTPNKRKNRDAGLSQNFRFRLENLEEDGESWDFTKTFLDLSNQRVTEELVRYVQGLRAHRELDRGLIVQKIRR